MLELEQLPKGGMVATRASATNAVQPMRLIKNALDPNNIFNPGKIFAE